MSENLSVAKKASTVYERETCGGLPLPPSLSGLLMLIIQHATSLGLQRKKVGDLNFDLYILNVRDMLNTPSIFAYCLAFLHPGHD